MQVKSESEDAKSYLTLSDPMDCSLLGSSVHGIFQTRVLEWVAIAFSETNLNNLDNHDGVITNLEPDILECRVKWALGSISMNKASGGD